MSLIEKTLGDKGRYQIRSRIGGGGMADVYLAQDTLLERQVAVKVLRGEYVNDEDFIARFRREAQSAARLSHPNIVNIYDVGTEGDIYYIIMEYVQGETLKDKLAKEGTFSPDKALSIALQIALALQQAHTHGIIHCDIKPHNILINNQGTVKVADFGIARAVSSATMAHTATIMGSVHYISPEQAHGTSVSKQSDVYSLGVVMYEMLTGKVPFSGDTPVSIALKHVQEVPPGIKQVNPDIPAIVDAIVAKAMEKQPEQRYASVDELIHDIKLAKSYLREDDTAKIENADFVTQVIPRIDSAASAGKPANVRRNAAEPVKSKGKSKTLIALAVIFIMVCGFMIGAFLAFGKFWSSSDIPVPNVVGKQVDIARNMLLSQNLRVNIEDGYSATVPLGYVISQYPEAGMMVKEQRAITLVVSKGGENTIVPDLNGMSKSDAVAALKDAGLDLGNITETDSGNGAPGTITGQSPSAGSRATKGQKVDVQINSSNSAKITVPDLSGLSKAKAEAALAKSKLKLGNVGGNGDSGTVVAQTPAAGAVVAGGTAVDITMGGGTSGATTNVSYTVPAGADKQNVKITVSDANGSRTVYEGTNKPGDVVSRSVSVSGGGTVQVLLNGNVVKELNL